MSCSTIIFINVLLIAEIMFTPFASFAPVKDSSFRAGVFAGFATSVVLILSIFSYVTFFTSATTPSRALLGGVLFATFLVGGGALLRWYLR